MAATKTGWILYIIANILQTISTETSHPVYEIINEPMRTETRIPKTLSPFSNPLQGNLQQSRLYTQTQQAMFNAEKLRRHQAQVQRWTKAPTHNNYMRAFHEHHDLQQMTQENMQATTKSLSVTVAPTRLPSKMRLIPKKTEYKTNVDHHHMEFSRTRNRDHRSRGSVRNRFPNIQTSATNEKGISIQPHGSRGLSTAPKKLYTEAVPSHNQETKPRNQMKLNTDIKPIVHAYKEPQHLPADLIYYAQDKPVDLLPTYYDPTNYAQIPQSFKPEQIEIKPIVQEVEPPQFVSSEFGSYGLKNVHKPSESPTQSYYQIDVSQEHVFKPIYQNILDLNNEDDKYNFYPVVGGQDITESEVSDDVKLKRHKRQLDTDPFLLPNETVTTEKIDISINATAEELRLFRTKNHLGDFGTFLTTPNFPIGEASEYNENAFYDDYLPKYRRQKPFRDNYDKYENEYDYITDDFTNNDYEYDSYRPDSYQVNYNKKIKNGNREYTAPQTFQQPYSQNYQDSYTVASGYGPPALASLHNLKDTLEPVYMLTETQLKKMMMGHHNLNIEHLSLYQMGMNKHKSKPPPRKNRVKFSHRHRTKGKVITHLL